MEGNKKKESFSKKAFTLIELLVVISIIGILAALALTSFTRSQRQARDTSRKADIKQYQTALAQYATANKGLYPIRETATSLQTLCATLEVENCTDDPREGYSYKYVTDGAGKQYVIWTEMESYEDNFWVICSGGSTGYTYLTTIEGGNCPTLSDTPASAPGLEPGPTPDVTLCSVCGYHSTPARACDGVSCPGSSCVAVQVTCIDNPSCYTWFCPSSGDM